MNIIKNIKEMFIGFVNILEEIDLGKIFCNCPECKGID